MRFLEMDHDCCALRNANGWHDDAHLSMNPLNYPRLDEANACHASCLRVSSCYQLNSYIMIRKSVTPTRIPLTSPNRKASMEPR